MVDFLAIGQHLGVDFHLDGQDRHLLCADLQLVWLTIETEGVDGVHEAFLRAGPLSANESKLDVGVQVGAEILERQFESLDALRLLHGQRYHLCVGGLVEKLLHAFDLRVVEIAEQEDVHLGALSHGQGLRLVIDQFLEASFSCLGRLAVVLGELDVDEAYDS